MIDIVAPPPQQVMVMIAPGFEETAVAHSIEMLRNAGLPTTLVSLTSRNVRSQHGIMFQSDKLVKNVREVTNCSIMLFPGGLNCIRALLVDPRVHHLLRDVLRHHGLIAATQTAEQMTKEIAIPRSAVRQFYGQGEQSTGCFVQKLIEFARAAV